MAARITLRFYEELNDFLPRERRKVAFPLALNASCSVKDLVESLGVPHTEVDLILVQGVSVGFDYRVRDGDRISVYPVFEALDITPVTRLRPAPLRVPRFVLDAHLGRLAAWLRMLGFDCLFRGDFDDATLARLSVEETRILLTRDRRLLMRREISRGYWIRARRPHEQLTEILARFDLTGAARPFTRCMRCNGLVRAVAKADVLDRLRPGTRAAFDEFWECADCGRVYWKGSHYARMQAMIAAVTGAAEVRTEDPPQ